MSSYVAVYLAGTIIGFIGAVYLGWLFRDKEPQEQPSTAPDFDRAVMRAPGMRFFLTDDVAGDEFDRIMRANGAGQDWSTR
jgi:hypothetical protein